MPLVFATSNGGLTWTNLTSIPSSGGGELNAISCLVGTDECWAAGGLDGKSVVDVTTNGGSSWTEEDLATGGAPALNSISCVNGSSISCWTLSDSTETTIYTSTDGGSTWSTISNPGSSLATITCPTATLCFATGKTSSYPSPGAIFELASGTWTTVLSGWYQINAVSCFSATDCLAGGMYTWQGFPDTYYSETGAMATWDGSSWTANIALGGSTYTNTLPGSMQGQGVSALSCPTASDCFGSGSEGIVGTQDDGSSWSQRLFTPIGQGSMACPSALICYWAPGDDVIYKTVDGGESWVPKSLPSSFAVTMSQMDGPVLSVSSISCNDISHCTLTGGVAAQDNFGEDSVILSTSDGNSWSLTQSYQNDPNHSEFFNTIACPPGAGWCVWIGQARPGAEMSYTGAYAMGVTVPSGAAAWTDITCPTSTACWLMGYSATANLIYLTTNSGVTWTSLSTTGFTAAGNLACTSATTCVANQLGEGTSSLMQTTDGGSTWTMIMTLPSGAEPNLLSCPDANNCVFTNSGGSLASDFVSTSNGGSSWTTTSVPSTGVDLSALICANDNNCWAAGQNVMLATDGLGPPEGGGITLPEVFAGLNPREPCFSCYLKQQGVAAEAFVGEPINTATGDFYESLNLFSLPGRGIPISFTLSYDAEFSQSQVESGATSPGPDGWGWTDNYQMSVSIDPVSDVATVTQENGSQISFTPSSASACPSSYAAAAPRITATLSCATVGANTVYSLSSNGGLQVDALTYNSSSQLTELTESDANANTTTVLYGQQGSNSLGAGYNTACPSSATTCTVVTDPAGRTFVLEYNSSSQLTGAVDPDGNSAGHTWSFTYDSNGNLSSVTDRVGDVTSFGYDSADSNTDFVHDMTSLTPPNGQSGGPTAGDAWAITYNSLGQVATQTDPQGLETSLSYYGNNLSPEGGTTTVTDPHGNVTAQTYAYGILTSTTTGVGTSSPATWTYLRDSATLMPTQIIDPNGNTTTSTYSGDGDPLAVTDGVGNETVTTYNSFDEPLTVTDPVGIETHNTYDSHGDLTETDVDGLSSTDISTTYVVCQTSCPSGYVAGDVESMTDPNGKTTTYTYDSYGDLATSSLTVGSLTDVTSDSYNTLGERYCEVSPNANAASVSCPSFGASRVAVTSTWAYDADGNVTATTDADGNTTSYGYDADGNQTLLTDPLSKVTKTTYDADDRTSTVTQGYGTSSATSTTDLYDINPGSCPSAPSDTTYCTQVENGLSNTTTSYYDGLDHMIEQAPPNTSAQSTTTYTYDGVGNVLTATDASGTTTYTYDADNRVTAIAYSDTASGYTAPHSVTYAYDADGNRTQMVDGTGTTTYGYDGLERLNSVTDGAGNKVTYKYDADGNPTCLSYPNSGSTTCLTASSGTGLVSAQYNAADQETQMTDWLGSGNTTGFTYDNDGNLTKITYPSGTTTSASDSYDNADALTDASYKIGSTTTNLAALSRNSDELIGSTTPPVGGATTYGYDPLNRVTTGTTATYSYDAASEVTSTSPTGGSPTDYAYNADGQLCWTASSSGSCTSAPTGATTFTYSSVGERLSSTPSAGHPTTYGWDQAGNMVCETVANASSYSCSSPNSSVTTTYGYNGDGLETSTTPPPTLGWSTPSDIDASRMIDSVSCASSSFCEAVDYSGNALKYNGSSWTGASSIDSRIINSVSCPTSSFCMAVDISGYAIKYTGSWSTPTSIDSGEDLGSVSCISSSFCVAMDGSGAHALVYNGSTWAKKTIDTSHVLWKVSCASTSFCMAVDLSGQAMKYSSGTWSSPVHIDTATNWIEGISCASSSFCVAVDSVGNDLIYNGSSWTSPTSIDGTTSLRDIVCKSSSFCQTVDGAGHALTYNGSTWTSSDIDGSNELNIISCPTTSFCETVDGVGNAIAYEPITTTSQLTWDVSGSVPQLLEDGSSYYLYGPNTGSGPLEQISINGSTPTYLISDTTGVREQIGSSGTVVGSMSYDSYGNRCSTCTISTPFGFEGGYTDPTGLVYLIHRYYDPVTEQFLSVDSLSDVTGTPYAFTGGDPVNGSDPSGLCNLNPFSGSFWSQGNCISEAAVGTGSFVNNESQTIDCNLVGGGHSIFNGVLGCANDKNGPSCASSSFGLTTGGNLNWKSAGYYKRAGIDPEDLKREYGYTADGDLRVQSGSGRVFVGPKDGSQFQPTNYRIVDGRKRFEPPKFDPSESGSGEEGPGPDLVG